MNGSRAVTGVLVFILCTGWLAKGVSAVTLVKDGAPACTIIVAKDATCSANAGAMELQYWLKKITGADLKIAFDDAATTGTRVLIGRSAATDALGVDISNIPAEGFIIKTVGDAIIIAGNDENLRAPAQKAFTSQGSTGTLYGVYDFLQKQLGCRWAFPGPIGEYAPAMKTIEVGELNVAGSPALVRRHMRLVYGKNAGPAGRLFDTSGMSEMAAQERQWYKRMRMGRSVPNPSGHSFTDWWKRFSATNPEIFALRADGTRTLLHADKPEHVKMDVSNPALWNLQIKVFQENRKKDPRNHELPCCDNDGNGGFCTCGRCKAWDVTTANLPAGYMNSLDESLFEKLTPGEGGIPASMSARYARWYNELARRVREVDPEGYVTGNAYENFKEIPIGVKLEPNILIRYHGLCNAPTTASKDAADRRDWLGWAQPGVQMVIRSNAPHHCENGMPFNVARENGADIAFALDHGLTQVEFDSMLGHWASWGPSYYVIVRQMWEGRSMSVEDLLTEYYSAFGPAEREVRAYYDFWEDWGRSVWNRPGETDKFPANDRGYVEQKQVGPIYLIAEHYPPEITAQARKLLDAAFKAAEGADSSVREKLQNIEMSLTNCELTVKALKASLAYQQDKAKEPELVKALNALIAQRRAMTGRNSVNVFWQTSEEITSGNVLHWDLIGDYSTK